ncbi:MAG: RNA methyltransferase, partial [Chloroflexi bacterium]|nr:RNA methyltransferase [Chloroflexota bacterium]
RSSQNSSRKIARSQTALLRKAVQLCRPGGRIVYATCPFAPEENELVVDAILREAEESLRLIPSSVPNLIASPGITQWQGQTLHPEMHHASRIWPQQNDTGGFFVAVLEKAAEERTAEAHAFLDCRTQREDENGFEPAILSLRELEEREPWLGVVTERFGIDPVVFVNFDLIRWSQRGVYLVSKDQRLPSKPPIESPGLFFMRVDGRYPKMTTPAALQFGKHATQNRIELTPAQTKAYLQRQTITLSNAQAANCSSTGYVILCHRSFPLGQGLFHSKSSQVESLFPKAWARNEVQL